MIFRAFTRATAIALLGLFLGAGAAADNAVSISDLSFVDRQYMDNQRLTLDDLARMNIGRQFNGNKEQDLALLQLLLDRKLVRETQKRELQAMGVIMGDHLARELNLHWVIYEDKLGRSRALRYKESDNYLFPMTMISRRREAGNRSPVADIYQRAVDLIKPQLPTLPFQ